MRGSLDGVHVEDFTPRRGQPAEVVLPPGEFLVRLSDGDEVSRERRVRDAVGETESLVF